MSGMMGEVRARVEATSAGSARLGSCPDGPPARRCWGEPLTPTGEVVGSAPTARALTSLIALSPSEGDSA